MKRILTIPFLLASLTMSMISCKKEEKKIVDKVDEQNRPFCNDPNAVNYNWDFPGYEDNSVCFYPSDIFAGNYTFYDTIYNDQGQKIDSLIQIAVLERTSNTALILKNFCSKEFNITATRTQFATFDTLVQNGQTFCNSNDTISGRFSVWAKDTIKFDWEVRVDSLVTQHRGLAIKQ